MFQNDTTDMELLYLFGGRRLLIIVGVVLYLIAGAALFMFLPQVYDWLRADARMTVQAKIVSTEVEYRHGDSGDEKEYRVTMEYVVNGMKRTHIEYFSHEPSGRQKLHVYCTRDGRWEVMEYNLPAILFLIAISVASALYGTHMLISAKRRKQEKTGVSA